MQKRIFLALALLAVVKISEQQVPVNQINWIQTNPGYWANDCDFEGNDLSREPGTGERCSSMCVNTPGCTHYAWSNYNGGTCFKKQGNVNRVYAKYTPGVICGFIVETPLNNKPNKGALVYSDDFNSIDDVTNNWDQETGGGGWGNNELQYYTNSNKNLIISAGHLTIQTRKENFASNRFTSARLKSKTRFRYGVFEMRAKLPAGRGTWPAFWLLAANRPLNWPDDGEIDIMEHVGYDMNVVHSTIHCKAYNHMIGTQVGRSTVVNDVANQWHNYQLEWTPTSITGFIDDQAFFRYDKPSSSYSEWPFDNYHEIILNTAVGGNWGGVQGVDENIWPQNYVIDYVRVWSLP